MPLMRLFSIVMLGLWLTACGGGGSIEKNDNSDGGTTSEYTLTLTGLDTDTNETSSLVSADKPLKVRALLSKEGIAQSNARITFTSDQFASLNPSSGTVLTNAVGQADILLSATANEGAGRLSAAYTAGDETVTATFDFNSNGGGGTDTGVSGDVTLLVSVLDKNGNTFTESNPLTQDNSGFITATLKKDGVALPRVIVSFATEFTGEIKNGTERAITDESGIARLELGSGQSKGAGRITATYQDTSSNESISKSDVFFSSGDSGATDTSGFLLDVKLLVDCNVNWDANRNNVLLDPLSAASGCQVVNSISSNDLADVYVRLTNAQTGDGVANGLIEVTTDLGTLLPSSGKALTDSFGVALLKLQPGTEGGAGTLTISSSQAGNVQELVNFAVGIADLTLSVDNGLSTVNNEVVPLKAGGSTVISVTLRDLDGSLYTVPTDVEFSSTCKSADLSELDSIVKTSNGVASATYRAKGCEGDDDITVNVQTGGKNFSARTVIPVLSSPVQSIKFDSVSETFIALPPGEGGIPTQSIVKFTLLDEDTLPVPRARVDFKLSDNQGSAALTQRQSNTDNDGVVQTSVKSGVVPGPLVVTACYIDQADLDALGVSAPNDDYSCWTEDVALCASTPTNEICPTGTLRLYPISKQVLSVSSQINLSSGVTDQDSFSASADVLNSNSLNYNGIVSNITVRFGDQFNQFNADGVTATVIAEAGVIGSIDGTNTLECVTDNASCTVQWRSQGDRPFSDSKWGNRVGSTNPKTNQVNCDPYFGAAAPCVNGMLRAKNNSNGVVMGGRVSVLAVAKGQESFRDEESSGGVTRRNGLFDVGEYRQEFDLSEAFLDTNENGTFDKENCSTNDTGPCSPTGTVNGGHDDGWRDLNGNGSFDNADGKYNGLLCSESAEAANECTRELIEVRRRFELVMSGDTPYVRFSVPKQDTAGLASYQIHTPADCSSQAFTGGTYLGTSKLSIESAGSAPSGDDGFCDINAINLSQSTIQVTDPNDSTSTIDVDEGVSSATVYIYYSDVFGNPLPADTEVTLSATNGELTINNHSETIPNTNSDQTMYSIVTIAREEEGNKKTTGALSIEFLIKNGDAETKITRSITVLDDR
ncbi:hypothetical protein CWB96_02350 [Pseudoalteromonas citrea]|uniref:Big-1 domain-containing protein n=1 Tax=Pseudoalteromonas citrea TaxID=43655 RepID=A0A5S3XW40_9GAMM|nr:hypothetical protein [Pseudoalteromonas citrea]TMP43406.1 hypothetical protein CWB97_09170 [Pseudoalteromonas citrea]TMP62195.1 hypothetical protein CWB96_02350 [Pseudoalteromonas citrea]